MTTPRSLASTFATSAVLLAGTIHLAMAQIALPDFTTLAAENSPAVVNISTTQRKATRQT